MDGLLRPGFTLLMLLKATAGLVWTSPEAFNNVTIPVCSGRDVRLPWTFNTSTGEQIVAVEWRYTKPGTAPVVIGSLLHGHFFTDVHLAYDGGAGVRLLRLQPSNTGKYEVRVSVFSGSQMTNYVQSVYVDVTGDPVSEGDRPLTANIQGAKYFPDTREHHLTLACEAFSTEWLSRLNVSWTTPDGHVVPSTYQEGNQFVLAVPNPPAPGNFTCRVDGASPAAQCVAPESPLQAGGTVHVDAVLARLALLDSNVKQQASEIQNLTAQNINQASAIQHLTTENNQQASEIHRITTLNTQQDSKIQQLTAKNTQMAAKIETLQPQNGEVRLVGSSSGSHEGRVEVYFQGQWGTVCDDDFDVNEAKVICRQLGLAYGSPIAYGSTRFGQGSGHIWLDNLACTGTERNIGACPGNAVGVHNCQHSEDAGVRCQ